MKRIYLLILLLGCTLSAWSQKSEPTAEPFCWRMHQPLGTPYRVPMDTLMLNYYQTDIPSNYNTAYGYTGNLGAAGFSKVFFEQPESQEFIFLNSLLHDYVNPQNFTFYNSRIPITQLSYLSGGAQKSKQQRLYGTFSGNASKELAFGGSVNYLVAKGAYDRQGVENIDWQLFGSYMGERYQAQAFFSQMNDGMQENGGISDDAYILTPEIAQGGQNKIDPKNIPVNLSNAYNRVRGNLAYFNQRYNVGFYRTVELDSTEIQPTDSITTKEVFVPVTSFIHTMRYTSNRHRFILDGALNPTFFPTNYLSTTQTNDTTSWWSVKNTLGISLLEGFNKYAKMGLSAYVGHEYSRYRLMGYNGILTPDDTPPNQFIFNENRVFVGGVLAKTQGEHLTYNVQGEFDFLGDRIGNLDISGNINTSFNLWNQPIMLNAYGFFKNIAPSFYMERYISNHFVWSNSFGKERRFRVGGEFLLPRWGTRLNVGVENLQNYVYFNNQAMPTQNSDMIQVFSAMLEQNFRVGILNWDNKVVYQTTSHPEVIPLPTLSAYSNLYLLFRISKVLQVQLGADCQYNTSYYAQGYQPATMAFYTQNETKVGDYPLMNVYANMKLHMVRFFFTYSHVNQGLFGGSNYFSLPHYPLPPSMFQMGVSVDFTN